MRIVDAPSPFAPRHEWEEFLAEMIKAEAETGDDLSEFRKAAEEAIWRLENPSIG